MIESSRVWLFSIVVGSACFFAILSKNSLIEKVVKSLGGAPLFLVILGLLLAAILIHENAKSRCMRDSTAVVLWACAISVYAVVLKDYWIHPIPNSFIVGGLIPGNDAAGWIQSTWHLLETNEIVGMGTRRPLDTGLRALFLIISGNLIESIKLTTFFCALSSVFLTLQVKRSYGWLTAVVSFIAELILIKEFLPLSMSAPYGFIFGNLGIAALLVAISRQSVGSWLLGLAALSIGLNIRAGPFFLLPLLWLWISIFPGRLGIKTSRIRLSLGSLLTASIGFIGSLLINQYWSAGGEIHSNLALHLYGMVSGGQGWDAALNDYPGLSSDELLSVSTKIFLESPELFFSYYFSELFEFFRLFLRYELGLSRSLIVIALVWLVLNRGRHLAQMLFFAILGIWLSSPFLMDDAGKRVFAVAFPILGILTGLGTLTLFSVIFGVNKTRAVIIEDRQHVNDPRKSNAVIMLFPGVVVLFGLFSVPFLTATYHLRQPGQVINTATCAEPAFLLTANNTNSVRLQVVRQDQADQNYPYEIKIGQFSSTLPGDGGDGSNGEIYDEIRVQTPPFLLIMAYDSVQQRRRYIVDETYTGLSEGRASNVLCVKLLPDSKLFQTQ